MSYLDLQNVTFFLLGDIYDEFDRKVEITEVQYVKLNNQKH